MPKVYVAHADSRKNVVSALDYGSIETCLPENINPGPENLPHVTRQIEWALREYTTDDWIILIGSPIAIAIACAVASQRTGGAFNVLKWDQQERRYFPGVIKLQTKGGD